MPEPDEFTDVIQYLEECIEATNRTVEDRIVDDRGGTPIQTGYIFSTGNWKILAEGAPDNEAVTISFPFNITHSVSDVIDESLAEDFLDGQPVPDNFGGDVSDFAAVQALESLPPEQQAEFRYQLVRMFTDSPVGYQLDLSDNGAVTGFEVYKNVFPYDDHMSYDDFDDCVTVVANAGIQGTQFVQHALDLDEYIEASVDDEVRPRYID